MIAVMFRPFARLAVAGFVLGALACSSLIGAGGAQGRNSAPSRATAIAISANARKEGSRTIRFSGYAWRVRNNTISRGGPGPNYFSSRRENVWLDGRDRLHLRAVKRGGRWYCAEIFSSKSFGYGTYTFTLASRVDRLDKNAVLGLFTWDDAAPAYAYREIDIEFSRWGERRARNAQYVVQPWQHSGNEHRFNLALSSVFSVHSFQWSAKRVLFSSSRGRTTTPTGALQTWAYSGADIPPAGTGHARINLWLVDGKPPANGRSFEIVVEAFHFTPEA
jgi:hypothetical protein